METFFVTIYLLTLQIRRKDDVPPWHPGESFEVKVGSPYIPWLSSYTGVYCLNFYRPDLGFTSFQNDGWRSARVTELALSMWPGFLYQSGDLWALSGFHRTILAPARFSVHIFQALHLQWNSHHIKITCLFRKLDFASCATAQGNCLFACKLSFCKNKVRISHHENYLFKWIWSTLVLNMAN